MIEQIRLGLSNVFLVRAARPVLVDTGRPDETPRLEKALRKCGVRPEDLALILLSHGHWDHAGGAAGLRRLTAAPVAIHPGDADLVRRGDNGPLQPLGPMGRLLEWAGLNRGFPPFEPDMLLESGRDLSPFGLDVEVVPLPGHSAGSVGIFFRSGDAIVGDNLMGGFAGGRLLPRRPNLHYFAQDPLLLRRSLQALAERRPATLYVGHGGPIAGDAFQRRLPALLRSLPA